MMMMRNGLVRCLVATLLTSSAFSWSASKVPSNLPTRRKVITQVPILSALVLAGVNRPAFARDPASLSVPKDQSVLVLGANGQTGKECVKACLAMGRPCIASSRSGSFDESISSPLLSSATVDVSSYDSIQSAVGKNMGAMVFAASASTGKNREVSFAVDKDGVINAARCCIANQIPRLVIVSSGTVTRPDSAVYKLLNFLGSGIMEAKIQGEDAVRDLYSARDVLEAGLGYTIVRPGGLTVEDPLGAPFMELNQGDTKSGRIARADVASLCVQALDYADTFDVTLECYEKSTAKPIESVGFSNILKSKDPTTVQTGFERQGETYGQLFRGLQRDPRHTV